MMIGDRGSRLARNRCRRRHRHGHAPRKARGFAIVRTASEKALAIHGHWRRARPDAAACQKPASPGAAPQKKKSPASPRTCGACSAISGGDGGIRTLDPGFGPDAPLAGECLRPLGHVSQTFARAREAARRNQDSIGLRGQGQFPRRIFFTASRKFHHA